MVLLSVLVATRFIAKPQVLLTRLAGALIVPGIGVMEGLPTMPRLRLNPVGTLVLIVMSWEEDTRLPVGVGVMFMLRRPAPLDIDKLGAPTSSKPVVALEL